MAGNNVLVGGQGNDVLNVTGSAGRNLLLGGNGADHLTGGSGDDILFNGTTSFDSDVATLSSLYTFWIGAGTFTTRVNALRAGTGGAPIALDSTNVFNDAFTDTMTGGAGSNWFLAKVFSPAKDHITDLNVNDLVN
jgi:Ca2+-binding RTX toxin-like protein